MIAVCDIRPQKTETHITRLTVGRNLKYYPREFNTPTSYLSIMKLHVHSTISDVKLRYMCMDVKGFYLKKMMDKAEYIMIHISMIPQEFVDKYNLKGKANNGYVFAQVTNGMYGLLKAGRISHGAPVKHLEPYAYHPSSKNPWTVDTQQSTNQLHLVSQ